MPSGTDVAVPSVVALISAAVTYVLGRRSQKDKVREDAYDEAWRLVTGLREEVDRCRARINQLEVEVDTVKREHQQDRERWERERTDLLRQLYGFRRRPDDTPPPGRER